MEKHEEIDLHNLSFSHLPNELIVLILSFITRTVDKQSTSLVSRQWWKLSWDLTTKLDIYFGQAVLNKMELADFQQFSQHCHNVTALHLTRITLYPVQISWLELFLNLPRIEQLTLTAMPVHDIAWLTNMVQLKSLSTWKFAERRYSEIELLSNLTHLDLSNNEEEISALLLGKLTNLVSLSFIDLIDAEYIFFCLTNLTKLRIRSLTSNVNLVNITNLTDLKCLIMNGPTYDTNIDHIVKLSRLETIKLSYSYTHSVFAERGLMKLMQMTALRKISFAGAHVSSASWSLLTHMTNLKSLDLKGAHASISVNGCKTIGFLRQLKKFEFPFNTAMDAMLETILSTGIELKSLFIHNCQQMTRSTLKLIVQLTSLQKLCLDELSMIAANDLYEVTILSNLRGLSLSKTWRSSDQLLVRPFLALTKLRILNLGSHVAKEEADLVQPTTMIFLEKFHCRKIVTSALNKNL
jgi:hypothetical protein